MTRHHNLRSLLCATLLCLPAIACDNATPSTPDADGVPCVGLPIHTRALLNDAHPFIYRGTVSAISAPQATGWLDHLIPSAHAYALDGESPVAGARVTMTYEDLTKPERKPLQNKYDTTTDPQGRFCIVAPRAPAARETIVLTASKGELVMRQLGVHSFDADINAASEAATRTAIGHARRAQSSLSPAQWLNLRTLEDTRIGLLSPVDATSFVTHEALVTHLITLIEGDPEIAAILR